MITARYPSCWEDVRAATRRSSSARSVANKRIRVRRGLDRGMCEGTFVISHYNRRASASIPYLHQPAGRGTSGELVRWFQARSLQTRARAIRAFYYEIPLPVDLRIPWNRDDYQTFTGSRPRIVSGYSH